VSNSRFIFEFEGFQLDTRSQCLRVPHDGRQLALKPKEFEVLLYFVEHAGDLIAKETLLTSLWPGQIVEENNLNQYVTVLRKLLGEERGGRRFIMNVRAKGYRFVPQVLQLQVNSANDSPSDTANGSSGDSSNESGAGDGVANTPTYSIYETSKNSQPTNNLIAWQCYQHGMHLLNTDNPERWSEAVTLFERAISLDADFGSAYAQLALTIIRLFVYDHPRAIGALGKARDAAKRAVALRPGEMDSYLVLGTINAIAGLWVEAEQDFLAGRDFDREWVMAAAMHSGYVLLSAGHLQRALEIGRKYLVDLQGVTSLAAMQTAVCVLAGDNDDARQVMELAVAMGTDLHVPPMPDALCMLARRERRFDEAASILAAAYSWSDYLSSQDIAGVIKQVFAAIAEPALRVKTRKMLDRWVAQLDFERVPHTLRRQMLLWFTELDALDSAYGLVTKALDRYNDYGVVGMAWGCLWLPEMASFRHDPRFTEFALRLKLPDYWAVHGAPDGYRWYKNRLLLL
jgi:DNA-binding winged helix-turn-helix (wHTH) protein/tetratricopeptide (TPR) repeat protein